MDFESILEMLINPETEGPPDDIFDQLRGAHTGAIEGKDSIIAENSEALAGVQAQLDAVTDKLAEAQAVNSDKLMEILMGVGGEGESDPDLNTGTLQENAEDGELNDSDFFETDKD